MNSSSSQIFVTPTSTPQGHHNNNNQHHHQHHQHQQSAGGAEGAEGAGGGSGSGNGSGSFVQRNSVQNQFAALSADRNKFVREVEEANKELKQIQVEHQSIKIEHDKLIEHNRQARAILGERMETLDIWRDKKARIIRETNNEGLAIRDCTNHSKTVSLPIIMITDVLLLRLFYFCFFFSFFCCVTDINKLDHDRWSLV
jgi:hypothetical protein